MTVIRLILALAFAPAFIFLVRGVGTRARALRGVVLMLGLGTVSITLTYPNLVYFVADALGVNSSLDLLVYLTILTLMTLTGYVVGKFRRLEKRLNVIIHELAVRSGMEHQSHPGDS